MRLSPLAPFNRSYSCTSLGIALAFYPAMLAMPYFLVRILGR
jgi:hypothetical protein